MVKTMKYFDLRKESYKVAEANKAGSRFAMTQDDFDEMLYYIDAMNAIPRDETVFGNYQVERIMIPELLKGMILPNSVTVSGVRRQADYLQRPTLETKVIDGQSVVLYQFSLPRWSELCDSFTAQFTKSKAANEVSLASLRTDVTLDKVLPMSMVEGKVSLEQFDEFFPIELNDNVFKANQYYVNDYVEPTVHQFRTEIRNFKFGK